MIKKIMFIRLAPTQKSDGTVNHCIALSELFENDKDVTILPIKNYKLHKIKFLNLKYHSRNDIERDILTRKPDIVHIHGTYTPLIANAIKAAFKYGIPIIYSPHFHPFKYLGRPLLGSLFFKAMIRPYLKYCNRIVTINNEDTAFFQNYHSRVVRIPHWDRFTKLESRNTDNFTNRKNMILFVGRIDNNKGIEHIYSLPEGKYEIHIVGTGKLTLRKDMIQHENVSRNKLYQLYKEASLLVVPSRYEAFSYVALEALINNTPIVISDRVRIGDYLANKPFVSVFPYHDMVAFNRSVNKTIGKQVDINLISNIFDRNIIKKIYKEIYLT